MQQLLRLTGFLPFLLVAFLNAFVDLGHKIIIQNTVFKVYDGTTQVILTAVVNALILLPFLLLFSPAGFLADRYHKPWVMRVSAAVAVLLTLVITASYYAGWFELAFAMTFVLAAQSAVYSPAKYGFIKELTGTPQLTLANGVMQAVTIVAILAGVFVFSILFEAQLGGLTVLDEPQILVAIAPVGWVLVGCSLIELLLAWRLPLVGQPDTGRPFDWGRYVRGRYLATNLARIRSQRGIWLSIVGLSVFWGISQVVLASFPALAKETLAQTNTVVIQGLLACSGIGIMLGSLLAGATSKRYIETGLVPLGALGVVAALVALPQLESVPAIGLCFVGLGLAGGLFIVPLNALIQFHAREDELGTVLAGNNWVQNLAMLGFLGLAIGFALSGVDSRGLFHLLTLAALIGGLYTVRELPHSLVRFVTARLLAGRYRVRVLGFEHLPAAGATLLLGNHISWLDWAIVQIACPREVRFVMHRDIYNRWRLLRWFFDRFGVVPIAGGESRAALQKINERLCAGEVVCLFPEGSISYSGQLGEFRRGFERTVEGVEGVIVPFYLRGLWGSAFSRSGERLKQLRGRGLRREVIVAFGAALPLSTPAEILKRRVFDLSIDAWDRHTRTLEPIACSWIRTVKHQGGTLAMTDARAGLTLSGNRALTAALCLARRIRRTKHEARIGLLLPTSSAGILANLAALLAGKTVVNLNYTASLEALGSALDQAEIRTVFTAHKFLARLEQRGIDLTSLLARVQVVCLEDLMPRIGPTEKLLTLVAVRVFPARLLHALAGDRKRIDDEAAILFSSGSEGAPKGVVLSHRNIMGNIGQVADMLDAREDDRIMATLPLFHAFGLTVTGLLPLIEGIPVVCHPDPTDTLNIARGIATHRATIYCATTTFLRFFIRNRKVHPLMLDSLRLIVAGAERLNPEVRDGFKLKFNRDILEGYGTTETTPVASVNIPDHMDTRDWRVQTGNRPGTVGMPLPGASFRIVDPVTTAELAAGTDGLILIGGTQVMQGYLNAPERTAEAIVELDGRRWYKSGDKGHTDSDGFLTIVDRYSRFAKIGGEMVSLSAVEAAASAALPDGVEVVATSLPDPKKGEQIVLLYTGEMPDQALAERLREGGLNPLMLPARCLQTPEIPKLGSGKNDYGTAREWARSTVAGSTDDGVAPAA